MPHPSLVCYAPRAEFFQGGAESFLYSAPDENISDTDEKRILDTPLVISCTLHKNISDANLFWVKYI